MNLEIHIRPPAGSTLLEDYLGGAPAVRDFYNGNPASAASYRRKAAEVRGRFDPADLEAMAEAVAPSSEAARRKLEDVVARRGFMVTTGQQAGLLGGPLYTVYKALTAARLARALEGVLDAPVAPLFWVASEDHDFEEVDHTWLLDTGNDLRRVELPRDADAPRLSMARQRLGAGIETVLAGVAEIVPPTEFAPPLLEQLRAAYRPDATVGEAFLELIERWLAPFDVLLTHAADPVVKARSADVLAREAARHQQSAEAVTRRTRRLEAAGYRAQVPVLEDALNLLYEDEHGRSRIVREDGGLTVRNQEARWQPDELPDRVGAEPERFSPNVMLRPVVESRVFPTLAYVGGPAEVAYFAQLPDLFALHGIGMPVVVPRAAGVLIEPKVRKVLDKFGLDPDALRPPMHEIAGRLVRDELPADVADALTSVRRAIQEGYGRLDEAARAIDPTLKGPVSAARNSSFQELGQVEKKVLRQLKEQNAVTLQQIEKARANLYPDGQPQERVLSPVHFLVRYGEALLPALAERIRPEVSEAEEDWGAPDG